MTFVGGEDATLLDCIYGQIYVSSWTLGSILHCLLCSTKHGSTIGVLSTAETSRHRKLRIVRSVKIPKFSPEPIEILHQDS